MSQKTTFEERQRSTRPINPKNGSFFTDLQGQYWEFRNGTWIKTITSKLHRMVKH